MARDLVPAARRGAKHRELELALVNRRPRDLDSQVSLPAQSGLAATTTEAQEATLLSQYWWT